MKKGERKLHIFFHDGNKGSGTTDSPSFAVFGENPGDRVEVTCKGIVIGTVLGTIKSRGYQTFVWSLAGMVRYLVRVGLMRFSQLYN